MTLFGPDQSTTSCVRSTGRCGGWRSRSLTTIRTITTSPQTGEECPLPSPCACSSAQPDLRYWVFLRSMLVYATLLKWLQVGSPRDRCARLIRHAAGTSVRSCLIVKLVFCFAATCYRSQYIVVQDKDKPVPPSSSPSCFLIATSVVCRSRKHLLLPLLALPLCRLRRLPLLLEEQHRRRCPSDPQRLRQRQTAKPQRARPRSRLRPRAMARRMPRAPRQAVSRTYCSCCLFNAAPLSGRAQTHSNVESEGLVLFR